MSNPFVAQMITLDLWTSDPPANIPVLEGWGFVAFGEVVVVECAPGRPGYRVVRVW
jgi:hypothetical protein